MSDSPAEYGVVGHPVAHSRSPFIHGIFAKQMSQNMVYRMHDIEPDNLHTFVMDFWQRGGKGLNVTVPHKVSASGMVRSMSERATRAGAVNTLIMDDDGITGDNTDGAGLLRDLTINLELKLHGARVLLLGSGGAARGVIAPLLDQSLETIVIAGRSAVRAKSLARQFGSLGPVQGCDLESIPHGAFDLIVNATSAGLSNSSPLIPATVINGTTFCYDLSYAKAGTSTVFLQWAKQHGCVRSAQGWGMLVEQAAESFELWRGMRPPTAHVLTALKAGSAA